MSATRKTGPRVLGPLVSTGPRVATAQPSTPPTNVQLGNDRLLIGAREVDISQITPDPDQPRKHMHAERLAELARSIARYGVLQPLVVRQEQLGRDGDMRYVIVAGGRRYAAVRLAIGSAATDEERRRLARVPVVITETAAAEHRVLQLIENLQREDLDPVEEARALKELMRIEKLTTDGVAGRVQRSQGYVDERLRLLRYEDVEEAVEGGLLTKSAAAAIASIRMTEARHAWLERARMGETIRAREVYASKPDRRGHRPQQPPELPNFGNSAPDTAADDRVNAPGWDGDSRPRSEVAQPPVVGDISDAAVPAHAAVSAEAMDARPSADVSRLAIQPVRGDERRLDADVERAVAKLKALGVMLPSDIAAIVTESPLSWPSILRVLADGVSAGERLYGERLLAIGTLKGMSCEELLTALRA